MSLLDDQLVSLRNIWAQAAVDQACYAIYRTTDLGFNRTQPLNLPSKSGQIRGTINLTISETKSPRWSGVSDLYSPP